MIKKKFQIPLFLFTSYIIQERVPIVEIDFTKMVLFIHGDVNGQYNRPTKCSFKRI